MAATGAPIAHKPRRYSLEEFAASCFFFLTAEHTHLQHLELHDTQCAFDTEHQLIVQQTQIIDLPLVAEESVKDLAPLLRRMLLHSSRNFRKTKSRASCTR